MKIRVVLFCILLVVYGLLMVPFSGYLNRRPIAIKLGYMPDAKVLKLAAGDFKELLAQHSVVRVLFYFGTLVDPSERSVQSKPDFFHMFTTVQQAVRLDPYNMDAYYFTQAAFTWELRKIKEVNNILDYGMKYRTWDAQLPFYAAFNCSYFLKDYQTASIYMKKAAEISGNPLYINLAARYFHEAGQTSVGLAFIEQMEKTVLDPKVKKIYRIRREALLAVQLIEQALGGYRQRYGHVPDSIVRLVSAGYLERIPSDPYGGRFYLTTAGGVRSTSKFAFIKGATLNNNDRELEKE